MSLINKKVVTKYGKTGVIESFNGRDLFVNYQEKTGQLDGNGNEMLTVSRKHYDVDSIRNGYLRLEKRQTKQDLIHWINNIAPDFVDFVKEFEDSDFSLESNNKDKISDYFDLFQQVKEKKLDINIDKISDYFDLLQQVKEKKLDINIFDMTSWDVVGYETDIFIDLLEHYFDLTREYYNFMEYQYPRFGEHVPYLAELPTGFLYFCGRYFDSINETTKADLAYLILMCSLVNKNPNPEIGKYLADVFDRIKDYIYPDWLALHSVVCWMIGMYYEEYYEDQANYSKAYEFFTLGTEIEPCGRQSYKPYLNVSMNYYELGLMWLYGNGREVNYEYALDCFEKVLELSGEPGLPIIGDMYYQGLGVEKNDVKAFLNYKNRNPNFLDFPVYFKKLNLCQQICANELEKKLQIKEVDE